MKTNAVQNTCIDAENIVMGVRGLFLLVALGVTMIDTAELSSLYETCPTETRQDDIQSLLTLIQPDF